MSPALLPPRLRRALRRPLAPLAALAALWATLGACSSTPSAPSSAFAMPIDFSWACEGAGHTVGPDNDESAKSINATRMCPDLDETPLGGTTSATEGDVFGLVLNRQPAGLVVMQLNPATGSRRVLDTDPFVPGHTPIPVGREPLRILRAEDFSAFYVVSAGDQRVDRVVLEGYVDVLRYRSSHFALPGAPRGGLMVGDKLVVLAATAELWVYDLGADPEAPPLTTVALPARPHEAVAFEGDVLLTWVDRPRLTRLGLDGTVKGEVGLAPACRDTLDNDGDGLTDAADADCRDADDDDESDATGAARLADALPAAAGFAGAALCANGVDDDGDGFTDYPDDPACADAEDAGEALPACADGVDNDGDGRTDFDGAGDPAAADPSCYGPSLTLERRLPLDGPFHPAVIAGGEAGSFVYVLDERRGEVLVFTPSATGGFDRVDVHAAEVEIPDLTSVPYGDPTDEPESEPALRAARAPARARQGKKNIVIDGAAATSLAVSRLRGELWERVIAPEVDGEAASVPLGQSAVRWAPARCAPGHPDSCVQPTGDDATWYAFAPRIDGRMAQIEVIRRGVPVHRLAQRKPDPADRSLTLTAPRLSLRGRFIAGRGEPQEGFAFFGAGLEELLEEGVSGESSSRIRRYGVWPPLDLEQALTETWTLTYEGRIPGSVGPLGRMTSDTTLHDPAAAFCEAGVAPGDWLALTLPKASTDPALHTEAQVITALGETCPTVAQDQVVVEVRVTRVGMTELEIDPATARLRPLLPTLDEDAVAEAKLSLRACRQALESLDDVLGLPDRLVAPTGFSAAMLPPRFAYAARVGDAWAIVGTVSGFLHRQRWDRATGTCAIDETLDPRLTGRQAEAAVSASQYPTCPPSAELLRYDAITALAPEAGRFENPSFALDLLPGCTNGADGSIALSPSQQDTTWSFTLTGPQEASTLAVSNSDLGVRAALFEHRRQLVQLDAAANRASLLQVRPDNPTIIDIFE